MNSGSYKIKLAVLTLLSFLMFSPIAEGEKPIRIRVGHFPTVTHAPALIARAIQHFEKKFQGEAEIEWKTFNAGPEAIEALFAGSLDFLYVGPNPAVNGFIRSQGEALRIVAGVASGGSAFVVREGSGIEKFEDIRGRRVATPQIGNTQDLALRHLMSEKGLRPRSQGGDVEIFNLGGGDQISAVRKGDVDAIWTVEPLVTRLVEEANGKILFDEKELWPDGQYATAVLAVRKKFLDKHPEMVQKWLSAHQEITDWIPQNSSEAKKFFNQELGRETGKPLPDAYLDESFKRITFTVDPMKSSIEESARRAWAVGFLGKNKMDLSQLYELSFLKKEKA